MVATAIFLHLRPHRHRILLLQNTTSGVICYSSSSSSSNSDDNGQNRSSPSQSPFSFSDVKASLKQTPPSPQHTRRPSFINPNSGNREDPAQKVASLEEIRKNLSEFRRRSAVQPPQSAAPVMSFQELYKRNVTPRGDAGYDNESVRKEAESLKAIRMSLKTMTPKLSQSLSQSDGASRISPMDQFGLNLKLRPKRLNEMPSTVPESNIKGSVSDETKIEFVRSYDHGELGKKLRSLRPGDKKVKFSLMELNERLRRFREMEEKEMQEAGGLKYVVLRESLKKLQDDEKMKKNAVPRTSVLDHIVATPTTFELYPPKEALVEKYFHPDHMSSAEKQKLELKKVREKFKISESDCGSARVQVAQLTTKIKHLASVLHKKDKHSRKGLQAMVQKRKKLLKYLRRTDWDSYCFCLSELGLRDSADYKA